MSNIDTKLLKMGEQIVANCSFSNDEEVIITKVADHLQRFWDPRMRQDIQNNLNSDPKSASSILRQAVSRLTTSSAS